MNIKSLKIISLISILLLVLNACAKPNIKTNKLLDSRYWGLVSIVPNVPTSNDISVYTNVGRTDGNTSSGDIKECVVTITD